MMVNDRQFDIADYEQQLATLKRGSDFALTGAKIVEAQQRIAQNNYECTQTLIPNLSLTLNK